MSVRITESIIQVGQVEARGFSPDCHPSDWQSWLSIPFPMPFPEPPRVIVTANDLNVRPGAQNPGVVGLATEVHPDRFTLAARNSDCSDARRVGFNWLAVLETPRQRNPAPALRWGAVSPRQFGVCPRRGYMNNWLVSFKPLPMRPTVLVTASDLNTRGAICAAVGAVRDQTPSSFSLDSSNSACAGGENSFYWAAFSRERTPGDVEPWIETGEVFAEGFAPDCTPGDWYAWDIYFTDPFLAPPVVLVTGNDLRSEGGNPAVVGIAQYVTPFGFRLAARNSDCMAGRTGFYWVTIGWPQDCCAGERG